jgi:hypothetical protein
MKLLNKSRSIALFTAAAATVVAPMAFAGGGGGPDVTGVVTAIQATAAPIGAIGAAVLIIMVAIKTYKWVRRAM